MAPGEIDPVLNQLQISLDVQQTAKERINTLKQTLDYILENSKLAEYNSFPEKM
jgi:hypothetical protein